MYYLCSPKGRMAEWLKALVSKTGIPFTGYRGFESPFFRTLGTASQLSLRCCFVIWRSTVENSHFTE